MLRRILIGLLVTITPGISVAWADGFKIKGRVRYAQDSTAAVGATTSLLSYDKAILTEATTDAEGVFLLTGDMRAVAAVNISMVGFVPVSIQIKGGSREIHLGDIFLIEDNKMLNDLVVVGSRRQINRQLVFPDRLQLRASQDVITLLQNLSLNGLSVDQINKRASIHDKPIQWKINGVPRALHEIRNLKPEAILRIDYSDTPSMPELDKGYGGIIDVILKERTDGGSARAHLQTTPWVGFVNASTSVSYHKDKSDFSIDYSSSYRNYPGWERAIQQEFVGDNFHLERTERPERSPFKLLEQDLNLTYLYKLSEKRLLSSTWRNSFGSQSTDIRNTISETGKDAFHRTSKSQYRGYSPALDLFYQSTLRDGGKIEANIVGTLSMGRYRRDLVDRVESVETTTYSNPVNTHYHSLIGEITYDKSIHPKAYLSTGLQNKYAYAFNEYLSINHYLDRLHQNNTYLFAQLSGRFSSKVQYQVGTGIKLFYIRGDRDRKTYLKSQSATALYYAPLNDLSLSLSSNFTPYLPALAQLSQVMQRFDNLSMHTGNSALKPSYSFSNRLNASYHKGLFNANLTLSYIYTADPIFTRVTYQKDKGYFLFQTDNGIYNKQYGAEWKVNYKNICNLLSLYATIGTTRYESNVGNNPLQINSLYWDISAQLFYKAFVLTAFYKKTGRSLHNETVLATGNNAALTLMWNKANWRIYAQMLYVGHPDGDTYLTTNHSPVNPYNSTVKIPENGNMFTLGIVWNLDFGKRQTKINRDLHNYDSNESVVKVQE